METKLRIIEKIEENPKGIHLREISRLVNTGLPNAKRFLEILEKEKVVRREKDANLVKFKLRDSAKTEAYLKQVHTENFIALPIKVQSAITEFLTELEDKPLIALVFGSYSKGRYTKDSDIDILLVFQKLSNNEDIENAARKVSMRTNTKISPIYLNYMNFEKNFLDKNHDFSREIRQKVILLSGVEIYYNLLWRFLK